MKIQINKLMQKLISNYDFNFGDTYSIDPLSHFKDLISNEVLSLSDTDDTFGYSINQNKLKGNINNIHYNFEWNNNTSRIDSFYFRQDLPQEFNLFYSFLTIGSWLSTLKKIYPKDKFIFLIQYDEGDSDIAPGFFVKGYHYRDFCRVFGKKNVLDLELPYISIEI